MILDKRNTRRLVGLLVTAGVLLHLPALHWGFLWDDFLHQSVIKYGELIPGVSPFNLYNYGVKPAPGDLLGDLGIFPWWTSEAFRVQFFRPVTSVSILLDSLLFGEWAAGYHVTNLLIFGLLLGLSYLLYRRLGAPLAASIWALAFLALDDIHAIPVGWIANRNSLLSNLFIVVTLLCVEAYERGRQRWLIAGAVVSFLFAAGSKETALTTVALVAFLLWLKNEPAPGESFLKNTLTVLRRPLFWVFFFTAVAYVGGYVLTGHGTNSALYSTPWQAKAAFAKRLATYLPVSLGSLFFGVSSNFAYMKPDAAGTYALFIFPPVALLIGFLLRRLWRLRIAWFAAAWIAVALAPAMGAPTSDRLLIDATLGSSLLLGLLFHQLLSAAGGLTGPKKALLGLLFLCGPLLALPMNHYWGTNFYEMSSTDREIIAKAEIPLERGTDRHVFLLNPSSSVLALFALSTWTITQDDPGPSFTSLQIERRPWAWKRSGESSLEISFGPPPLLSQRYERLFRTSLEPPPIGTVLETVPFDATVLEVDDIGIRRVQLDFRPDLEAPSTIFLLWKNGALRRVPPPPLEGDWIGYDAAVPLQTYVP